MLLKTKFKDPSFIRTACAAIALAFTSGMGTPHVSRSAESENGEKAAEASVLPPKEYAIQKLEKEGLPKDFIQLAIEKFDEAERDRVVELNVLGFMKRADYSGHFSRRAILQTVGFLRKYGTTFRLAEKWYGVQPEIIASLLWVETKHGKTTGHHSVLGVFFGLLQADHPDVMKTTLQTMKDKFPELDAQTLGEYAAQVLVRSKAKAAWAMTEITSLAEIHKGRKKDLRALKGSYAGAFGYPQFIPSSYNQWARARKKSQTPDLFKTPDAIFSVAFYLKAQGWKKNEPLTHEAALFHYNRSKGYVDVILKLAEAVKKERIRLAGEKNPRKSPRQPASEQALTVGS